jgi:acyl-homoserine-lactone acylase
VVDGSESSTLWTEYHAYAELPRVLDPEVGWLQNANDPPWTSTVPQTLAPTDFPAYMAPTGMGPRPQRSANMLRADTSLTFDEVVRYKHSTTVEMADRILDELLEAARASDDGAAREAADVLAGWDRTVDADSRGGLLFEEWLTRWLRSGSGWKTPWSDSDPADTPDGIADEGHAVRLLAEAAADVRGRWGALDVAWGDVHRAKRNGFDVPVSGGPGGPHGIFRVAGFQDLDDGSRVMVAGDTYYAVMEFGPEGAKAQVLLAYGNATQPHSSHNGDQLSLFARQEMRTPWRTRAEIEANLESVTVLRQEGS